MDLTVISGGVELNVSGVTEETTCLQIVYALAHATNQKGKFVLVAHLDGHEHRLSQSEKPLEIVKQCPGTPITFELRHLDQQEMTIASTPTPSMHASFNANNNSQHLGSYTALPSQSLKQSGKQISLPPNGLFMMPKGSRPPPPTYHDVIGQRCSSLSRDHSKPHHISSSSQSLKHVEVPGFTIDDYSTYSRTDLERIIQHQLQYITHQKSQLLDLDVRLSNSSERELVQLKKQHNNLVTVLNSLRNVNWPLRLQQAQDEGERLHCAVDEMKSIVDHRKNELLAWVQYQQTLEGQLDVSFSEADTLSPQDDSSQYWSINDYAIS